MTDQSAPIDLDDIVAEIEQEASARIASGEYPRSLLRGLDEAFRRWIPDGSREHGIEDAIRSIEAASYLDAGVPVDSNKAIGRYVKTGVRKATFFYHRHMAQQITALGIQITRPLRLLDNAVKSLDTRLAAVEAAVDVNVAGRDSLLAGLPSRTPSAADVATLAARIGTDATRIMVADCGDGDLVDALQSAGLDVFGVGAGAAPHPTLDLRDEAPLEFLDKVPDGSLGGAVLVGLPDRLALNEQLRLLTATTGKLADGAPIAIVVTDADQWRRDAGPVVADLIAGRPLHTETWTHLLEREHAADIRVDAGDGLALVSGILHR